jgi:hypothetical protein
MTCLLENLCGFQTLINAWALTLTLLSFPETDFPRYVIKEILISSMIMCFIEIFYSPKTYRTKMSLISPLNHGGNIEPCGSMALCVKQTLIHFARRQFKNKQFIFNSITLLVWCEEQIQALYRAFIETNYSHCFPMMITVNFLCAGWWTRVCWAAHIAALSACSKCRLLLELLCLTDIAGECCAVI